MSDAVLRMIVATSKVMDVHLLTSLPLRGTLATQLKAKAAIAQRCSRKMKLVTIVSPHRGLAPEIMEIDFWKSRLWKMLLYQAQMVSRSTAVVAINEKERNDIMSLGLKKRIEVLPEMTGQNTSELTAMLTESYRKALDSSYRLFLLENETKFLNATVRTAVADEDVKTEIPSLGGLSFRRISFLAYDESATELMQRGAQKADLILPQSTDAAKLPRYKNKNAKSLLSLEEMSKTIEVKRIEEVHTEERRAVQMIVQAQAMGTKRMTLGNWVELYDLFRNRDFNEDTVGQELRRRRLKKFTKKLQKSLTSRFELKEGYVIFQ